MSEFSIKELGTIECKKCGYTNINGVKYCAKCKTRLIEYGHNVCPRCGTKCSDNQKKCNNCGFNIKNKKVHRFISTLLQLILVGVVGYFLIKYGDKYNIWVVRFIILMLFSGILIINTKEYNKPIEYHYEEDPALEKTIIDKKKTKKRK